MRDDRGQLDDLDSLDRAVSEAALGRRDRIRTGRSSHRWRRRSVPSPRCNAAPGRTRRSPRGFRRSLRTRRNRSVPAAETASCRGSRHLSHPWQHTHPRWRVPPSPRRWLIAQASLALLLVVLAGGLWLTAFRGDPGGGRPFAESILVPERSDRKRPRHITPCTCAGCRSNRARAIANTPGVRH